MQEENLMIGNPSAVLPVDYLIKTLPLLFPHSLPYSCNYHTQNQKLVVVPSFLVVAWPYFHELEKETACDNQLLSTIVAKSSHICLDSVNTLKKSVHFQCIKATKLLSSTLGRKRKKKYLIRIFQVILLALTDDIMIWKGFYLIQVSTSYCCN